MAGHLSNRQACGAIAGEGRMEVTPFGAVSRTPAGAGEKNCPVPLSSRSVPWRKQLTPQSHCAPEHLLSRSHPFRVFPRGAEGI